MPTISEKFDLLIVDDDKYIQQDLQLFFSQRGFKPHVVGTAQDALTAVKNQVFSVAIVDMQLPDLSGLELMTQLNRLESECEVIMLTGVGTIESAVEAMKIGAIDFLTKPVRLKELEAVALKAHSTYLLKRQNRQLQGALQRQASEKGHIIGGSAAMKRVLQLVERVAKTDKTILIQGESGTGKDVIANAIHAASKVSDQPFIAVNCAALPDQLIESEMFGHEKGAFTGATTAKQGLFEIADGGTLFIDEIGELAITLQAKLLRVLEDGSFRRVGSTKMRRANARIIAATNRDLAAEVEAGRFREDLFYRINILTISLPPLSEREDDIALLIAKFAGPDWTCEQGLLEKLKNFPWPGNIRQLKNAVERAKILSDNHVLELRNFPDDIIHYQEAGTHSPSSDAVELGVLTRQHIEQIYQLNHHNKTMTARALGVSRRTLYRLLEKYEICDEIK
ncbi:sigma-54-dependent transcriptional regulator [Rubinisphaera italica]|uniref:Transcriptional regulatory protein ZraR n=1 Tax=Rubinisphaera italica TaxID=2527969 RepID=A0A5C5XDQ8_9PLAN|nr:sigma-54 dependent transcriptional regulator [Rubinisphaera italica]TWT60052.1 Transcriptional regulatory protein ZraR [Rubinisphaera italica]